MGLTTVLPLGYRAFMGQQTWHPWQSNAPTRDADIRAAQALERATSRCSLCDAPALYRAHRGLRAYCAFHQQDAKADPSYQLASYRADEHRRPGESAAKSRNPYRTGARYVVR